MKKNNNNIEKIEKISNTSDTGKKVINACIKKVLKTTKFGASWQLEMVQFLNEKKAAIFYVNGAHHYELFVGKFNTKNRLIYIEKDMVKSSKNSYKSIW